MEEQVRRIQNKTAQLLEQYQQLLNEIGLLKKEKNALEEQLAEKEFVIKALELAKSTENKDHSTLTNLHKEDLEKKLNQYIQEIDQCINLLKQ